MVFGSAGIHRTKYCIFLISFSCSFSLNEPGIREMAMSFR